MKCYSCNKLKNQLHPKKSDIIDSVTVLMCQSCIDAGFEPRWLVVLGGRSFGPARVRNYISKHLYVGKEITGQELIS
jgi:hypothetical protein